MAFSGRGLLRAAANLMGAGYRGAERGRQMARKERLEDEALKREAEMDALQRALLEAQTERLQRPERTALVTGVGGVRVPDVPGTKVPVTEGRTPLVTDISGTRVPDQPGVKVPTAQTTGSATITKAVTDNRTRLKVIDDALLKLEQRPEGVGLKGLVPEIALQRMDPEGVDLRAAIGDIGSLVIHDRSGAAVTAKEMPRLEPFIPKDTDPPDAIRRKLNRFREILEEETRLLEQGGRPSEGPAAAEVPPATTGVPTRFLGKPR